MEAIRQILEKVMRSWEEKLRHSTQNTPTDQVLKKFLTKRESGHIRFRYFKRWILGCTVDSSSWLYYFNLRKKELLEKIRQILKDIEDIRFYIGEVT